MQNGSDAQQLVIEQIKQATNILVTVEKDPSVDELAGALAFTLMLNKMDKRGTAVFSGAVPPAIKFLEPDKTFEPTVNSLRDFIIALDKEKADRLRYKVEDDRVKIFITPYRTVLSAKDLEYSEGDFNVELIVALGVEKKDSLDKAIAAHGRILHDATVVTLSTKGEQNELGAIDWQDPQASSICEMLVALSGDLDGAVLDSQISTALLTGIVAATERFSNARTSAHVMNVAAELMAAGANQQLIANNLQAQSGAGEDATDQIAQSAKNAAPDKKELSESSEKIAKQPKQVKEDKAVSSAAESVIEPAPPAKKGKTPALGGLQIDHPEEGKTIGDALPAAEQPAATPVGENAAPGNATTDNAIPMDNGGNDLAAALANAAGNSAMPAPSQVTPALITDKPPASSPVGSPLLPPAEPPTAEAAALKPQSDLPQIRPIAHGDGRAPWQELEPPTMGGTLNATAAEAAEEKAREAAKEQQKNVTLMHKAPIGRPVAAAPVSAAPMAPPWPPTPAGAGSAPVFNQPPVAGDGLPPLPGPSMPPAMTPTPTPGPFAPLPSTPAPTGPTASWAAPQPQPAPLPGSAPTPPAFPAAPLPPEPAPVPTPVPEPDAAADLEAARQAVSDALASSSLDPAGRPMAEHTPQTMSDLPPVNAPAPGTPPPLPDFSALPSLPAVQNLYAQPRPGQDITQQFVTEAPAGAPPAPLPGAPGPLPPASPPPVAPAAGQITPANPADPTQFKIPGH